MHESLIGSETSVNLGARASPLVSEPRYCCVAQTCTNEWGKGVCERRHSGAHLIVSGGSLENLNHFSV